MRHEQVEEGGGGDHVPDRPLHPQEPRLSVNLEPVGEVGEARAGQPDRHPLVGEGGGERGDDGVHAHEGDHVAVHRAHGDGGHQGRGERARHAQPGVLDEEPAQDAGERHVGAQREVEVPGDEEDGDADHDERLGRHVDQDAQVVVDAEEARRPEQGEEQVVEDEDGEQRRDPVAEEAAEGELSPAGRRALLRGGDGGRCRLVGDHRGSALTPSAGVSGYRPCLRTASAMATTFSGGTSGWTLWTEATT